MKYYVSNSCFVGDTFAMMAELPPEYGIEIMVECGSTYYWETNLAKVMNGRTGGLSVHGPFIDINLAAENLDEEKLFDYYKWTFELYQKHHAESYVLHPDGKITAPATAEDVRGMQQRAMKRIEKLAEIAKPYGIRLLVENMRPKGYGLVFDQDDFIRMFDELPMVDCLIDVGHMQLSGWDFKPVAKALGSRIKAYHMNDNFGRDDEHIPVGHGLFDWGMFVEQYKQHTPEADFVLEYKKQTVESIVCNRKLIDLLMK